MLSQIHKRNNGNKEHTLSLIDGMVEMVEGMKIPVEKMKHDMKGNCDFERNKTLSDLKSLLLEQREIIEKE